jgi:hypothetical protein
MKKKNFMIALFAVLLVTGSLSNCGYPERGHANTPAEAPGDQTRVGVDTLAHPGNIDRDSIEVHE